jgi:hypothetical protein
MMARVDSGVYIAIFELPRWKHIRVGSLGRITFEQGLYAYMGSAQKRLNARCHGARQNQPARGASKPASVVMRHIPHRFDLMQLSGELSASIQDCGSAATPAPEDTV